MKHPDLEAKKKPSKSENRAQQKQIQTEKEQKPFDVWYNS